MYFNWKTSTVNYCPFNQQITPSTVLSNCSLTYGKLDSKQAAKPITDFGHDSELRFHLYPIEYN